ncbi:sodium-dependent multivitamin transporter-like [Ylistrum balloti]|uniref:sodium-dependent multivitamin transporter-like n=1 Tax=Ylistrum balloti TaxID=509963 RepID=UPI002905DC1F|nr:sodium-dependent multivitamin transporter-like [Ylistrum balloti]
MWASVLVVAFSAIIYTAVGGLRAVVWTDVFQFIIMLIGIVSVIIKTTLDVGGIKSVFENANAGMRLQMPSFDPDPTIRNTMWTLVIGSSLTRTYTLTTQTTAQRICSVPTERDARKVAFVSAITTVVNFLLSCFLGIFVYAYFHETRCDPLESKAIKNSNQLLPYLVVVLFRDLPGMAGVFIAALFSASLSTISSLLSSLSAQTIEDIVKPIMKDISESRATVIAKILVFVYGFLGIAISFIIANIKGPLTQITMCMLSSFGGAAAGMFFFAAFCPWANSKGTVVGGMTGMALVLWISLGQSFSTSLVKSPTLPSAPVDMCRNNISTSIGLATSQDLYNVTDDTSSQGLDILYSISYIWLTPLSILTTILVGTITSFLTGRPVTSKVDVRYMLPFFDLCCPWLPVRMKKKFYCGAKFEKRQHMLAKFDIGTADEELNKMEESGPENEENDVYTTDT